MSNEPANIKVSVKAGGKIPYTPQIGGHDGKAATIRVGTVTTGKPGEAATVTNIGTENDAVFNFKIPRGETGHPGAAVFSVKEDGGVEVEFFDEGDDANA